MLLLFQYRQIFHRIAFQALPPGAAVPVSICWVDALLVQLSKVTIFVAGGFNFDMDPFEQLESLRPQLEEDHLRAAAQLPRRSSCHLRLGLIVDNKYDGRQMGISSGSFCIPRRFSSSEAAFSHFKLCLPYCRSAS